MASVFRRMATADDGYADSNRGVICEFKRIMAVLDQSRENGGGRYFG